MTELEGGNSRPRLLESVDDQTKERIRRSLPVDEDVPLRDWIREHQGEEAVVA